MNPLVRQQNVNPAANGAEVDEGAMYCLLDDEPYLFPSIPTTRQISYPSTFFVTNSKPILTVQFQDKSLQVMRNAVYKSLLSKKPKLDMCIAYLVKLLENQLVKNDLGQWISYGITIAEQDQMVGPLCMIEVNHQVGGILGETDETTPEGSDTWMPLVLCSLYRISRSVYPEYKEQLINSLRSQPEMQGPAEAISVYTIEPNVRSWQTDNNYTILMAALDMFFYRFPNHDYAKLRFGTIVSRFKDCASLISWQHLCEVSGIEKGAVLCQYIYTKDLAENVRRIFKKDEEIWGEYSYFPYQVDFRMVTRSAYSAAINPNLYYWCSVVSCLIGSPRSRNARFLLERDVASTKACALWIGYILATQIRAGIYFETQSSRRQRLAMEGPGMPEESVDDPRGGMPIHGGPTDWFGYITERNFDFPEQVVRFFLSQRHLFANSRPGTIGEHLSQLFREMAAEE